MGLAAAVVGAGALGAVGSIVSGGMQAGAAEHGADLQYQASKEAAARLQPFADVGQKAIPTIYGLLGIPGADGGLPSTTQMQSFLENTPGYQFTRQQGLEATQNGFAGAGLARSGAAMKGAAQFTTGLANLTYQQTLANYTNLLANSQSAAAGQGGALIGGANAAAAGLIGSANAWSGGIQGATSNIGNAAINYAALQKLQPTGGIGNSNPWGTSVGQTSGSLAPIAAGASDFW